MFYGMGLPSQTVTRIITIYYYFIIIIIIVIIIIISKTYCCKSLNKQSSGFQERINPF
jgi:hypothetical protein